MDDDVRPSRILHFFGVLLEKLVINSHKKVVLTRNRVHVDSLKLHLFLEDWQLAFLWTRCLLVAFLPSLCTHFFKSMKLWAVRELGFSTLMKLISSTEKSSSLASSGTQTGSSESTITRVSTRGGLFLKQTSHAFLANKVNLLILPYFFLFNI